MEIILSVDQSAVASLWDVLMSNVSVSTALLQLKMCKLACAFVKFEISVFALKLLVSCDGLLAMEDCLLCQHQREIQNVICS